MKSATKLKKTKSDSHSFTSILICLLAIGFLSFEIRKYPFILILSLMTLLVSLAIIFKLDHLKSSDTLKISSLNFYRTLLFHLKLGVSYQEAIELSNVHLAKHALSVSLDSDLINSDIRYLDLGNLKSSLESLFIKMIGGKKVQVKSIFIERLIEDKLEEIKLGQKVLNSFLIHLHEINGLLVMIGLIVMFYPGIVLKDQTLVLTISFSFLLYLGFMYQQLINYGKETI